MELWERMKIVGKRRNCGRVGVRMGVGEGSWGKRRNCGRIEACVKEWDCGSIEDFGRN